MTSPVERSLVLVKPDAVRRGLLGEILARFERKGLVIEALELRTMDAALAGAGIAAASHEIRHVHPPPAMTCIAEGPGAQHAGQQESSAVDHPRKFLE